MRFWQNILPEGQLDRYKVRENRPFQRFKITAEVSCSKKKILLYDHAVADRIDRRINRFSLWALAPASDAYFSRIIALLLERIDASLRQHDASTASQER
jgi:AMP-polyphosphate phosphotransferase